MKASNIETPHNARPIRRECQSFLLYTNPGVRAMVKNFHQLNRAKAEVAAAAEILRMHHDRRQEPNNREVHMHVDELLQTMLRDFEQLIGCNYICRITKAESHE